MIGVGWKLAHQRIKIFKISHERKEFNLVELLNRLKSMYVRT